MIPLKLKLENFLSHKNTEIDFTNLNAICLYGENGAGKTSILDGMLYALYSYTSRGRDDFLIRLGERKMRIEFLFEMEGTLYRVVKEKEIGKTKNTSLYMVTPDEEVLVATGERVDEYIENLLGMNYDTFTSTFFLLQDNAYRFILATPTERYKILFDILGLEVYQEYRKVASYSKREAEGKVTFFNQQIADKIKVVEGKDSFIKSLQNVEQELSRIASIRIESEKQYIDKEKDLSTLLARIKEIQKITSTDIEKEILNSQKKIAQYQTTVRMKPQVEEALKRKTELNRKLTSLFESERIVMKEYDEVKAKYNEVVEKENKIKIQIEQIDSKIREHSIRIEQSKKTVADYEKVANLLNQVPCGGVGQYATCRLIANAVESKEKIPQLQNAIKQYEEEIKKYEQEKKSLTQILQKIAEEKEQVIQYGKSVSQKVKELQIQKDALTKQIEEVEKLCSMQSAVASAEKALEMEQERLKQLEQEKEKLAQTKQEEQILTKLYKENLIHVEALKKQVTELKNKETELIRQKSQIESQIELCNRAEQELKELQIQLDEAKKNAYIYSVLDEAYEKIPKIMFTNYIVALESKVNEILNRISNSGMQVELVTEKQTKTTKTVKNTLDIIVSDIIGERRIENFSGGEKTRLTLAFTVALSELASKKAGHRILTLAIDEPPGLDMQGFKDFASTINQLIQEEMFAKCFVISHSGELIDEFEQKIRVQKLNGSSQVTVEQ
ncbi:MAG: AAA family ATPase [Candidatus Micrarchaeia archaeon]